MDGGDLLLVFATGLDLSSRYYFSLRVAWRITEIFIFHNGRNRFLDWFVIWVRIEFASAPRSPNPFFWFFVWGTGILLDWLHSLCSCKSALSCEGFLIIRVFTCELRAQLHSLWIILILNVFKNKFWVLRRFLTYLLCLFLGYCLLWAPIARRWNLRFFALRGERDRLLLEGGGNWNLVRLTFTGFDRFSLLRLPLGFSSRQLRHG